MAEDEARAAQRAGWDSAAAAWRAHAELIERQGRPVTEHMLAAASPHTGERVLELACGPAGVGLAAAARMGAGEVVLSDFAEEMVALAAERAAAITGPALTARVLDLEAIDEPGGSFDIVLCRMGLMFAADPVQGAAEMARVLRPGGRAAVAVWGPRAENPWLGVLMDAVGEQFGIEIPPPGVRGPFSLAGDGELAAALEQGGFRDVGVERVETMLPVTSTEEWWSVVPHLGGMTAQLIAAQPDDVRAEIRARAVQRLAGAVTPRGVPGLALVARGSV